MFELKGKFCHLIIIKKKKKKEIVKQLSSCITEKYNGFPVTPTECSKKIKKKKKKKKKKPKKIKKKKKLSQSI